MDRLTGETIMLAEAAMGVSALKTAFDIAKGLKDIDDATRRNAAVIELQKELLGAQQAQSTLIQQVSDLEKEVTRLKAWDTDKQRYQLTDIGTGACCYTPKVGMENGEPPHKICASCYNHGHKSLLSPETWIPRASVLVCHDCGSYYYQSGPSHAEHQKQKPVAYRGD